MMTAKRFQWVYIKDNTLELRDNGIVKVFNNERLEELLNELHDENKELHKVIEKNEKVIQYKQSVNDVLRSWSQKNLTAKQLQVVLAIMEELNVIGDVE